ncbi:YjjG family noncanonical pyrimidine nucleotidase [Flavobacterium sp. SUN052]|uniref:YjjG family noncanonical pyrimidine nucleotidase n=1 Tax=Flavobacterium sp. SUN052 TaxID=3002441 RepID=UPI00237DE5D5|nr:YjjG family noncanonical pyrimidine nucleotidase [Flavobacterium sp. SUN052]MEC4004500.1 YjjG family noncanonical pyrimidine nucleotidase [Flavobacterium sp. SUN052]
MEHIKHVFFDLDHTLWDFDKNSELAFDKIFKLNHPTIDTKSFVAVYAPINQACWKLYQVDKITHEELRYRRLKDSFDALNYTISDDEINRIADDYITFLPENNQLFDGAKEILDYLKPNYNLHIITNGFAEVQYKKLNNSGILVYFLTITNSEKAGVKKPHPRIYEYALASANAKKENSIMIGDCIDADVNGALNFGIDAIHFNESKAEIPNHIKQVNHLIELKNYL